MSDEGRRKRFDRVKAGAQFYLPKGERVERKKKKDSERQSLSPSRPSSTQSQQPAVTRPKIKRACARFPRMSKQSSPTMDLFSVDGLSSSMRSEECFGGEKRGERKKKSILQLETIRRCSAHFSINSPLLKAAGFQIYFLNGMLWRFLLSFFSPRRLFCVAIMSLVSAFLPHHSAKAWEWKFSPRRSRSKENDTSKSTRGWVACQSTSDSKPDVTRNRDFSHLSALFPL